MPANNKPFVAIIGDRNAGKSTIIRCLTGVSTGSYRGTVTDGATGRTIEVIASSPQENRLSLAALRGILQKAKATNCNGVVCAIQPSQPRTRPSMEQILQLALTQGFAVHAYVLDPTYSGVMGNAASVRARTSKIGVALRVLDARRFGHLSAQAINRRTRVVA
jgi:energy-coupling factor transporter ATP-binding protein EcfA2